MRAGPKRAVTDFPLDLSHLPKQRAARACKFIQTYIKIPKGKGARKLVRLRDWQIEIIHGLLTPGIRQALISLPRGNGKSALAAMLALYGLFADGVEGAQVLTVASDERQARHVWGMARRMIELNEELNGQVQMFQDRIYAPHTDSVLAPLPAEPDALQGWDPSMCIVDELHVVTDEVYDAMQLASGKRDRSLVLSISTAAGDKDGVMYRLTEHGRTGDDPSFFLCEYNAPDGCDLDDEAAWHIANPALHDFLAVDALRSTLQTTREEVFRRYRLNQWVGTVGAWMPWGSWEEVIDTERLIDPEEPVVLAFDGSISDDSSAIVGCTVNDPHVFVADIWNKDGEPGWRVPRAEVTRAVDSAFERYNVSELACDPWHWHSEIQAWHAKHGDRVIEWPTNVASRMAPATDRLRSAVIEHAVTHDGHEGLGSHVRNAVVKQTNHGDVVVKDRRGSPRKIDACVCAIVAHDRAAYYAAQPAKSRNRVAAW